jgi:hypothetical protein
MPSVFLFASRDSVPLATLEPELTGWEATIEVTVSVEAAAEA